jgi:methyl-accepting chemotaxis protein
MKFRTKVFCLSTSGIVATSMILTGVIFFERGRLAEDIGKQVKDQGYSECGKIAKDVYLMLQMEYETEKIKVSSDIKAASMMLEQAGGISFADEKIKWNAVNQTTKTGSTVELPKMQLGGAWLGQNDDLKTASPFVDKVQEATGNVCTVFQRLNDTGDMLRVSTNVPTDKTSGKRAVGTYIPATAPDGKPNPVLATVLRGETYVGRAKVLDDWYVTA